MRLRNFLLAAAALVCTQSFATYRYVGGDISLLPEYEKAGAQYKDHDGTPIAEVLPFLHQEGMNAMR
ncbi:MAG: arabinogalactan endo-1,4-beta-galactosidase, partial [Muribaculaceae bacterium]|nr:arabinogalactan endo-1,4-beta-galactosidase [Muribaculaceae bacterium]